MENNTEIAIVVMDKLELLAGKMGLGADEIFGWYVQQIYVHIRISFVFLTLFTLAAVVCGLAFRHYLTIEVKEKEKKEEGEDAGTEWTVSDVWGVVVCLSCSGALVSFICAIINSINLCNVKYHAFNNLLDKLSVLF